MIDKSGCIRNKDAAADVIKALLNTCFVMAPETLRLLQLREVKELTKFHRWEFLRYNGSDVEVELTTHFENLSGSNRVLLRIGAHYTVVRSQICRRLLDYVVDAEFDLGDARGLVAASDVEIVVSADILRLMFSVALGAMRGMIALRTADTFLSKYPLPVYDISALIANLSPSEKSPV